MVLVTEDPKKEVTQGFASEKKKSTKSYIMEQIRERERERGKDA